MSKDCDAAPFGQTKRVFGESKNSGGGRQDLSDIIVMVDMERRVFVQLVGVVRCHVTRYVGHP